jgi:tRNA(fMet)-specific endonuclease VapC
MPPVVVDTCVVSYLYNNHSLAEAYRPHVVGNIPGISFMTLAELHYGALKSNWGEQRHNHLTTYVMSRYVVYPFEYELCWQWARVRDQARRIGRQVSVPDAWIASTALLYGISLITNNPSHYEGIPNLNVVSESS